MRAEDAGARTWLYAALAGWAVCVWVLALFGMGGSIDRLEDDPSLRQALPAPGSRGAERLGPLGQYGEISRRPLFTDNRRPQPFTVDPMGEPAETGHDFDYVLTSVLRTPDLQLVILQPTGGGTPVRVKLGEAPEPAPGWTLQTVEARKAVFSGPQGERTLELRVFDGVGGEPPTRVVATPPPAAAGSGSAPGGAPDPNAPPVAVPVPPAAPQRPGVAPGGGQAVDVAAQQRAAQDQVETIRRRIEERRARLRQEQAEANRANALQDIQKQ
ncbi:MAG: hypothetical protein KIS72_09225 [Luteimonas sp.]|nr:hypothetical protein [Luteimonas sp.]